MRRTRATLALFTTVATMLSGWSAQTAHADQNSASIVQIVAHEDDDLLFMNPDVLNGIRSHTPIATVYLTAGEANVADPVSYARERQLGVKLAYAQMAGVPCSGTGDCWAGEELPLADGHVVEHYWLTGNTSIQLFFLDLPDGGDANTTLGGNTLRRLWDDPTQVTSTLLMSDSGHWPQRYDKGDVQKVLSEILSATNATLVRVQDPAPDPTLLSSHPDLPEHDNPDHVSAAWFADAAVADYTSQAGAPRTVVEHYRDYNIAETPANLASVEAQEKNSTFVDVYAPHDGPVESELTSGGPTCKIPGPAVYRCYPARERLRTPRGTQSVTSDKTGALHAFVVENGQLFEWAEDANKVWQGPTAHAGGPLAAGLVVGHDANGWIQVFGQRADTGAIVSRHQLSTGGWDWTSLGSPNASGPSPLTDDALQVSIPAVANNEDGRLQLFVRNRGGGISSTWQLADGSWVGGWTDMGGANIQGAPAAWTRPDKRIELFAWSASNTSTLEWSAANASNTVLHWTQTAVNQPFAQDKAFPSVAPTSDLTVGQDFDGRLELFYRQLDSWDPSTTTGQSYTMSLYQTAPNGGWAPASGALGGGPDQGGIGAPAVVTPRDGRIVTAVRNRGGGVSLSRQSAPNSAFSGWTDLGGSIVGVPAASVDRDGHADLVAIGTNGRLYDNRQLADGSFAGWTPMGSS